MSTALIDELKSLPVADRLDLVEILWDSITAEPDSHPLTEEQIQLIEDRLESHRLSPTSGIPWQDLKQELASRACCP